ncbi:hypothetical protein IX318_002008 [Porphyromonas levii]|nr:hypothetical protein [Porphyromonas levii]MBR8716124.1 hypothetical protein [Porphyromonas levii]MBR8728660.1 hypothetical protein [Porphyromonas levii]MBR8736973.1 hypothetical protein [Porphyromonas levii]MBR8783808.1 hypothetical protein [Porphyromonas levii]
MAIPVVNEWFATGIAVVITIPPQSEYKRRMLHEKPAQIIAYIIDY